MRTKISKSIENGGRNEDVLLGIGAEYSALLENIEGYTSEDTLGWINECLPDFEKYYTFLREDRNKKFSHQSDFLSSLVPEFLYQLYLKFVVSKFPDLEITTQKDIVIDMSFLPYQELPMVVKPKRVDVAIIKTMPLKIDDTEVDFNITMVGVEVKTNLDKNMISGVEYSVDRLKKTFPLSKFYLISEFADFAFEKQNYASSQIDEIIILRKQKRSEVRRDISLTKDIDIELVRSHIDEVLNYLESVIDAPESLNTRMQLGKLIN
ncbi:Bpu10I family restriction endonuclease [Aureibaculum luteum]|uniref:Bpu10I family restriction endonuclease n=1 Tax=Aureibaculum luteum TaxID=1548456 RepID=UPI001300782F|nr:Bpu10I family restriction endonuclease [Aureibaculum luteum]